MGILQFDSTNCKDCCKCVAVCPVKAIEVKDHRATIVERDCILCGNCTVVCPQGTKHDTNDVAGVRQLIHGGKRVVASVAPSYVAYYSCGWSAFVDALKKLGFSDVRETAEGAYLVKTEYERILHEHKLRSVVSSCCATLNSYVRKYCPDAIPFLAPVATPMQAHARLIHSQDESACVVFIGPCISKKLECRENSSDVAYALTFSDLDGWMRENNIELEDGAAGPTRLSRFFPAPGGIIKTMEKSSSYRYIAVEGPANCIRALHDLAQGKLSGCFLEMNFCVGSCIGGPAFAKRDMSIAESHLSVAQDAVPSAEGKLAEDYDIEPIANLASSFGSEQVVYAEPSEQQIAAVFKKMGKSSVQDELNCSMCGYASCRDKAIAVLRGRAEITMCMPYMKKRAESLSDNVLNLTPYGILAVDLDFRVQHVNLAACKMFHLEADDILGQPVGRLVNEFDFVKLISDGLVHYEKTAYLVEYSLYLSQSFYYDESSGIIICIMKDITQEKDKHNQQLRHKTQLANMADDIVEKQLRIVHEIASLLGESAAETKWAISELKQSVMLDET